MNVRTDPVTAGHGNALLAAAESPRYRAVVLAMLVLVYTFNFIDRQIVGILAVPIKADLGLTDTQLGLMGGLAFALFYTALGIPIAMLADRRNRTHDHDRRARAVERADGGCGLAQNFLQLFLARLGVGVGEAGGVAPAYSLVADYFPPHQRARALGVYSFGIPIGSALGIVFGGFIAHWIDWRTAFIAVGGAGLVLAPLFKWVVREPQRGRFDGGAAQRRPASLREVMRVLLDEALVLGHLVRCVGVVDDGLRPVLLAAVVLRAQPRHDAGPGFALLRRDPAGRRHRGHLARRMARRSLRGGAPARVRTDPGDRISSATVPFFVGAVTPRLTRRLVRAVPVPDGARARLARSRPLRDTARRAAGHARDRLGDLPVREQPDRDRPRSVALGALSDALSVRFGSDSLRYAILAGTVFYFVAAGLFLLSAKRLERDWE